MDEYITKSDRRNSKRETKEKKWIKHSYWENWSQSIWNNISKFQKKILKAKIKEAIKKIKY